MIDPDIINKVLDALPGNDYASNVLDRTYPRGLDCEAFTFKVLEHMWKDCNLAIEREHVTWHIVANREKYRTASVKCEQDYSEYRLTVDEPDDLKLMRAMFELLPQDFRLKDVVELLKANPELALINAHVEQKRV
jgi:spore coat polysaccharide biosynthesis protein SpsF